NRHCIVGSAEDVAEVAGDFGGADTAADMWRDWQAEIDVVNQVDHFAERMALGASKAARPVYRAEHLEVLRIVCAVAQLAFQAPWPHLKSGAAADIEPLLEALARYGVLSDKRPGLVGMALIRYGPQVGPAAFGADVEAPRQHQLRPR